MVSPTPEQTAFFGSPPVKGSAGFVAQVVRSVGSRARQAAALEAKRLAATHCGCWATHCSTNWAKGRTQCSLLCLFAALHRFPYSLRRRAWTAAGVNLPTTRMLGSERGGLGGMVLCPAGAALDCCLGHCSSSAALAPSFCFHCCTSCLSSFRATLAPALLLPPRLLLLLSLQLCPRRWFVATLAAALLLPLLLSLAAALHWTLVFEPMLFCKAHSNQHVSRLISMTAAAGEQK